LTLFKNKLVEVKQSFHFISCKCSVIVTSISFAEHEY